MSASEIDPVLAEVMERVQTLAETNIEDIIDTDGIPAVIETLEDIIQRLRSLPYP